MIYAHSIVVLFALLCSKVDASPTTPKGATSLRVLTTRMVENGAKQCEEDADCALADLVCDKERKICVCKEQYAALSPSGTCLPAKQLGEACSDDVQCQLFDSHALCRENFCVCDSGFYLLHDTNGSLCDPGGTTYQAAGTELNLQMIIIIACLAIMFLGICVALHLFSKARFRNRRTIFNSPHPRLLHIKLGKKKKRPSSSHLTTPVHQAQPPRHHSFSGHHSSPLVVARVSKTRSHECLRSAGSRPNSPKFEPRSKTAPLAEKESLPSTEEIDKKTPEPVQPNGVATVIKQDQEENAPPGSPTVIITDADGAHRQVVTSRSTSATSLSAVNV